MIKKVVFIVLITVLICAAASRSCPAKYMIDVSYSGERISDMQVREGELRGPLKYTIEVSYWGGTYDPRIHSMQVYEC